jgi:Helix-turn-helix
MVFMATLAQVIGRSIRQWRESHGLRQEDIAAAARRYGLDWTQGTIAAIELGQRQLTLDDVVLFPIILAEVDGPSDRGALIPNPAEFVPETAEEVMVGPLSFPARVVRAFLGGREIGGPPPPPPRASRRVLLEQEALGTAEMKAARRLGVSAGAIVQAARRLWGQSLAAERDQRMAQQPDMPTSPRSLQALRGHVTRELLDELRPVVKGGTRKGRTRR